MIIDVIATAGIVVLVGIPATAILVHRTAEAVVQTLAHANLALPAFISRFVVTPTPWPKAMPSWKSRSG